ncbi:RNA methyltransferase [Flavobacterium sp. CYK-55]|uniref:TrmH family RNA methyltransferase n=1 Tax=Flavobacterium sp. CYK-55 TaxID=2835529 RepID=UPI001BCBA9E8|nr:RNA methyltransferase [Flavobacterium sp. CYK-55]MBS7785858.1 RNA methyltransferase [Flavobacterium sp. CYK-55]
MVSKNQLKLITSLQQKKYRNAHQLFTAEGVKVIRELLNAQFKLHHLYTTESIFESVSDEMKTLVSASELAKMSALSAANNCLAVFEIPELKPITHHGLSVVLDDVRDPGNLGTILRMCDWFGVEQLICSRETVDLYNPKVVQATMGSLARVQVHYVDLPDFFKQSPLAVFGTFMDGDNIYQQDLPKEGIIVLGNEANGISTSVEKWVHHRISIPRFGRFQQTESLNVASAAAIVLSEFFRSV